MSAPIVNVMKNNILKFKLGTICRFSTANTQTSESTGPAVHHAPRPLCRTSESDPTKHHAGHEALFYTVADKDYKRFYVKGQNPHFGRMCKAFHENCVMVRRPALELKHYLEVTNYNLPVVQYILYGGLGSGKTLTMAHLMHYCALKDWLLVHIPWGAYFLRSEKERQVSTTRPGRIDQTIDAADWLSYFYMQNKPFFEKHQPAVNGSYVWTKREQVEPGTPFQEIIDFGVGRTKYSADAIGILMKEVKEQANQKKFKALVAVDGVNSFWEPTIHKKDEDKSQYYHGSELSVIHHFKKMLQKDWRNGAVICTVDKKASTTFNDKSDLPLYLLKQEGFEFFDPFVPIHIPDFSDKEAYSCIEYFIDRNWIQKPEGLTEEGKQEILFLSNKNPFELFNVTRSW